MTLPIRIGIGGPVGSGKTALLERLCRCLAETYDIAVITNDHPDKHNAFDDAVIAELAPLLDEGDIIIVSPHDKAMSGDYVVAKNDEDEATFKQYKRYDNTRILHPLNPKYPDIVLNKDLEYRIVGVVMEKKKRYK